MAFFSFSSWLKNMRTSLVGTRRNKSRSAARTLRSTRLLVETLETRLAPASIAVNDTADVLDNPTTVTVATLGPNVSLRDAVNAANNSGGANTIVLADTTYNMSVIDNYWYGKT